MIRRLESENAGRRESAPHTDTPAHPEQSVAGPAVEQSPAQPPPVQPPPAAARPQAPVRKSGGPNRKPLYAVAGALGLVLVAAIATLAYLRRNEPPAVAGQRPPPVAQAPASPTSQTPKTEERVNPGQPEAPRPAAPPAAPPVAAPPPPLSTQPPPAPSSQPAIAVANRLVMAMEGTDRPENIVVRGGSVVWRTETISGGPGQAPQLAIKAQLDVPEARMRGEITVQRNRDPAFPASHTVQVQFSPGQGSEFGNVRNLSQIELRQSENQPGYPLAGQGIAVVENLFLLALAQIEPAQSRNVEMMRSRPIVYIEFQSATGRRGGMVIEKGVSGQQAFEEAFRSWQ